MNEVVEKLIPALRSLAESMHDRGDTVAERNLLDAIRVLQRKDGEIGGCETCRHSWADTTCFRCHRCSVCGTRSKYAGYEDRKEEKQK